LRRLLFPREWSHDEETQDEQIFPRSTRTRGAHGAGTPKRVFLALGGGGVHCPQDRLFAHTLHEWVKRHEVDTGLRDGITSEERDRLKALERENKELRRANEILKLASAFFAQAELDRRLKS